MAAYHAIELGLKCNAFLIEGEKGYLLIDAGRPGYHGKFFRSLKKLGVKPEQIVLCIVTHVHLDHVGSLCNIKKKCAFPIAVHANEVSMLSEGKMKVVRGTTCLMKVIGGMAAVANKFFNVLEYVPVEANIIITDEISLEEYGFFARVVPTPGHTSGSLSVVTDDGDAFVGDLAVNMTPSGFGWVYTLCPSFLCRRYYPHFAEKTNMILENWRKLFEMGVKRIIPTHGSPFKAERLKW
jgi:hydroxyacylglutathione hydrolase